MSFEDALEWKAALAISEVSRQLARSVPAPRGTPYFGLDVGEAYDLHALDALSTRGIFRKYEFALDLGAGLGGRTRWLAARLGCRAIGLEARPAAVAAAALLNRRAHVDDHVGFQTGALDCLPLRERVFTHVWMLDAPPAACTAVHLAEAFRVLRRGGYFVLQCPALSAEDEAILLDRLRATGFFELESHAIAVADPPHIWRLAQARLRTALDTAPDVLAAWADRNAPPSNARRLQIFGRRPA